MNRLLIPIILISFTAIADKVMAGDLPNNKLTPGVARQVDVQTLCTTSTKTVRLTTPAMKALVYKEYGLKPRRAPECTGTGHSCYEVDHKWALEDGGADDVKNLWPQAYDGKWNAHQKDKLENLLHAKICAGKLTIAQSQALLDNWIQSYTFYFIH